MENKGKELAKSDQKKNVTRETSPCVILTIAGSDPSGGAGIQADIKTVSSLGGYPLSVITAITAQNTARVSAIREADPFIIKAQLEVLSEDIMIDGIKIGMIYSARAADIIADFISAKCSGIPVVLDPVIVSTSGHLLMQEKTLSVMKNKLFPLCTAITPNIPEAEILAGCSIKNLTDMEESAVKLLEYGSQWVIVKGGHLPGETAYITDIIANNREIIHLTDSKIPAGSVRGTGCTFSSALAFYLAKGYSMVESAPKAKAYIEKTLKASFALGSKSRILGHFS